MTLIPPSEEVQKKIKEQLYQDPEVTAQDVRQIKEWISKQPHLPQEHDDVWIERVLYGCKYSVERCKKIIDNYYTLRSVLPQYFVNTDPTCPQQRDVKNHFYRFVVPKCAPDGHRVAVCGPLHEDASKFDLDAVLTREVVFFTSFIYTEPCLGYIQIYDARHGNMAHLTKMIAQMNNIAIFMRDSMPIRVKEMHFVNASAVTKKLVTLLTPLLKDKLKERIHVHTTDSDTLYNFVPKEILPAEFGGQAGTINELNDAWQLKLESMKGWIAEEFKKKTDESKRQKDSVKNEMFGTAGNFKALSVD